jgi:hypothetical protein
VQNPTLSKPPHSLDKFCGFVIIDTRSCQVFGRKSDGLLRSADRLRGLSTRLWQKSGVSRRKATRAILPMAHGARGDGEGQTLLQTSWHPTSSFQSEKRNAGAMLTRLYPGRIHKKYRAHLRGARRKIPRLPINRGTIIGAPAITKPQSITSITSLQPAASLFFICFSERIPSTQRIERSDELRLETNNRALKFTMASNLKNC